MFVHELVNEGDLPTHAGRLASRTSIRRMGVVLIDNLFHVLPAIELNAIAA